MVTFRFDSLRAVSLCVVVCACSCSCYCIVRVIDRGMMLFYGCYVCCVCECAW